MELETRLGLVTLLARFALPAGAKRPRPTALLLSADEPLLGLVITHRGDS